ncbi:Potassium-transporting ATPase ATP-binding subunit [uncultured archaeon]|nr:Potassium-transporting ATPase ATP-binding subunit [uncultured archaeon]
MAKTESARAPVKWHTLSIEESLRALGASRSGLSSADAVSRLKKYGPNEIMETKKKSDLSLFIDQFKSFLIGVLLLATLISALLEQMIDAVTIATIVLINAVLGFLQVKKAEAAVAALKRMAVSNVKVMRDGQVHNLPSKEIVPGDVILLSVGDKVPADCRIIQQLNLKADESILTGESVPVGKDEKARSDTPINQRRGMVFAGTTIIYGRCEALVVLTGMGTEFGKIAETAQQPEGETSLQKKIDSFGKTVSIIFIAICFLVFLIGFVRGIPPITIFLATVALAVAAVPEGLLACITIALAVGVDRMSKRNAIIKRLAAVEGLGSVTVICSDKTGTLTVNEMTVRRVWTPDIELDVTGEGYGAPGGFFIGGKKASPLEYEGVAKMLKAGMLCNDAFSDGEFTGDPTEIALLVSAKKAGIRDYRRSLHRSGEIQFDSDRKMMSVLYDTHDEDGKSLWTKGAVERLVRRCSFVLKGGKITRMTNQEQKRILDMERRYASKSFRILGFAMKKVSSTTFSEDKLVFLGMQAMMDPPRPEAKEAIARCRAAGIRVIMVTGDHKDTATSVARELGILDGGMALSGDELDALNDKEFDRIVDNVCVYSRTSADHKMRITETLKGRGHIVAVTGDGINDVPALRKADIGVAMGITGTDVAREVADMVISDDNFATIVSAVEEGRGIYGNIRKTIAFLMAGNIAEVAVLLLAVLVGLPLPLIAIQLLWINLVTNGLPALALAVDPINREVMSMRPRPKSESLTDNMRLYLLDTPLLMAASVMGLFLLSLSDGGDVVRAQTVATTAVIMFAFSISLTCRSLEKPVGTSITKNKYLILTIIVSLLLHTAILYIKPLQAIFHVVPLTADEWLGILAVSFAGFLYIEAAKAFGQAKNSEITGARSDS